jgi:CHAT domain-containing protein
MAKKTPAKHTRAKVRSTAKGSAQARRRGETRGEKARLDTPNTGVAALRGDATLAELDAFLDASRTRGTHGTMPPWWSEAVASELGAEAPRTAKTRGRVAWRVYLLPGIMGSRLRRGRDHLWIDPWEIATGQLDELTRRAGDGVRADGALAVFYGRLARRLRREGYDVVDAAYDWRQSIDTLGAELAARILSDDASQVHVVAHSMGGLVLRAACRDAAVRTKIARAVMLGTPNHGSYVAVQAFRGDASTVRALAAVAFEGRVESLVRDVFASFAGLTQLLPFASWRPASADRPAATDESAYWLDPSLRPRPSELEVARRVHAELHAAPLPSSLHLVAGHARETVQDIRLVASTAGRRLHVFTGPDGDGTVPLESALLDGVPTWLSRAEHSSLPNDRAVGDAVVELLEHGTTRVLPAYESVRSRSHAASRALTASNTRDVGQLSAPTRTLGTLPATTATAEVLLADFVRPLTSDDSAYPGGTPPEANEAHEASNLASPTTDVTLAGLSLARRTTRQLEVRLVRGSIVDVPMRAWAVGVYAHVDPAGAASAIDEGMEGAISELVRRRALSADPGALFLLPTGRHRVYADVVAMVGLGSFSRFDPTQADQAWGGGDALRLAASNLVRGLARAGIDEVATVLYGGGSGVGVHSALTAFVEGVLLALRDMPSQRSLRRLALCELDDARYAELRHAMLSLAATDRFADVMLALDEEDVRSPASVRTYVPPSRGLEFVVPSGLPGVLPVGTGRPAVGKAAPLYLTVRESTKVSDEKHETWSVSLLTAGARATVLTRDVQVTVSALQRRLSDRPRHGDDTKNLATWGEALADLVLPSDVRDALVDPRLATSPIVLVHDLPTTRVPWEALHLRTKDGLRPLGLVEFTRRIELPALGLARWLEQRPLDEHLDVLSVCDPTADLPGAAAERAILTRLAAKHPRIRITELFRGDATKSAILDALRRGTFDVLHVAAHAEFDPRSRRSTLLLEGDRLGAEDLVDLPSLPRLALFNACESARVRSRSSPSTSPPPVRSLAEVLLRGGVGHFIGTYWPVTDAAAERFSETLFESLLAGQRIAAAVTSAREAIRERGAIDWANYIHWGSRDDALKTSRAGR